MARHRQLQFLLCYKYQYQHVQLIAFLDAPQCMSVSDEMQMMACGTASPQIKAATYAYA
jgi:hypothetical protein